MFKFVKKTPIFLLIFLVLSSLTGCVGALLGGAAVGTIAVVHDRRTPGTVVDDSGAELNISRALAKNKSIGDNSHINVNVYNAVALATGEAANSEIRQQIIDTIKSVKGLKRVEHDIVIAENSSLGSRSNDTLITTKVKSSLLGLKIEGFDPTLVKVITERGHVYLMGILTKNEAKAISDVASRIKDVRDVTQVFEYLDN